MINLSAQDVMNIIEIKQTNVIRQEMLENIDLETFVAAVALISQNNTFPDMDGGTLNRILYSDEQIWNIVFPVAGRISDTVICEELYEIYINSKVNEKTKNRILHINRKYIYKKAILDTLNFIEAERLEYLKLLISKEEYLSYSYMQRQESFWLKYYISNSNPSKLLLKFVEDNPIIGCCDVIHTYEVSMKEIEKDKIENNKDQDICFSDIFEISNSNKEEKSEVENNSNLTDSELGFIGIKFPEKKKFSFRKRTKG